MPAAVPTAFVIAFWFADRALDGNEYLQPQKLQRLMFLAQCAYAVRCKGGRLMPAAFVADELGPIEPNILFTLANGRPEGPIAAAMPAEARAVLDDVWNRFGHCSAEHLARVCKETLAYRVAFERGNGAAIDLDLMRLSFAGSGAGAAKLPAALPKMMRTQSGRPVSVQTWTPAATSSSRR